MLALLQDRAALFGLTSARSLSLVRVERQRSGDYLVELRQTVNGVPVTRDGLLVIIDASGFVRSITGAVLPERAWPPTIPLVGRAQARLAAGGTERATESLQVYDPETGTTEGDEGLLAWLVEGGERSESAYVDAISGRVIARFSAASGATHREVLDAEDAPPLSGTTLFGTVVHDNECHTATSGDVRACSTSCSGGVCQPYSPSAPSSWPTDTFNLWRAMGQLDDYWLSRLGRDGWDDNRCGNPSLFPACTLSEFHRMRGVARHRSASRVYALWGRGGSEPDSIPPFASLFSNGTTCRDLVWHEFTHGLNQSHRDMGPPGGSPQAVTLNESMADVFAKLVEVYVYGTTSWRMPDPDVPASQGGCSIAASDSRPLADPAGSLDITCGLSAPPYTTQPFPDHLTDYRAACSPYHNLTIPGRVGYLLGRSPAAGASMIHGVSTTGVGEGDASRLFYDALTARVSSTESFSMFRSHLMDAAAATGVPSANVANALDATGFWTPDRLIASTLYEGSPGWTTQVVNGVTRRYFFYREANSTNMAYIYRTCSIEDSCSFSAPTVFDPGTSGVSAVHAGDVSWVCFRNAYSSGSIWCDWIDSIGTVHYGPDPIGASTNTTPTLVFSQDRLFLAWRAEGSSGAILFSTFQAGAGWSLPQYVSGAYTDDPRRWRATGRSPRDNSTSSTTGAAITKSSSDSTTWATSTVPTGNCRPPSVLPRCRSIPGREGRPPTSSSVAFTSRLPRPRTPARHGTRAARRTTARPRASGRAGRNSTMGLAENCCWRASVPPPVASTSGIRRTGTNFSGARSVRSDDAVREASSSACVHTAGLRLAGAFDRRRFVGRGCPDRRQRRERVRCEPIRRNRGRPGGPRRIPAVRRCAARPGCDRFGVMHSGLCVPNGLWLRGDAALWRSGRVRRTARTVRRR
ncbi:MAG: M4 family metallopeptidase [Deltaproteobacteria bacterium]|nr:M4 family metallopeptidase [Deltaproteobacteria bacterium]